MLPALGLRSIEYLGFIYYNYLMMNRLANRQIIHQSQEGFLGCCVGDIFKLHDKPPSRIRVYSEPKQPIKKISLVSPRRGQSHGKTNCQREAPNAQKSTVTNPKPQPALSVNPQSVIFSKITAGSKGRCKIIFDGGLKDNRSSITAPSKIDLTSLQASRDHEISEISLVSEQFISKESASYITNLLNNRKPNVTTPRKALEEHRGKDGPTSREETEESERKNPIERLLERKREQERASRRRKQVV